MQVFSLLSQMKSPLDCWFHGESMSASFSWSEKPSSPHFPLKYCRKLLKFLRKRLAILKTNKQTKMLEHNTRVIFSSCCIFFSNPSAGLCCPPRCPGACAGKCSVAAFSSFINRGSRQFFPLWHYLRFIKRNSTLAHPPSKEGVLVLCNVSKWDFSSIF